MRLTLLLAAALGFVCLAARAEPYKGVLFAGGSVSEDVSAYAGAVIALPGASLGRGFAVKTAVNGGHYDYEGGPGVIDADYYGGVLALVRQWSGRWGWANLSAGAAFTQTDLSPDDPANERAGSRFDAALASDGALYLDEDWRFGWYAEGGARNESYLARVETTRAVKAGRWRFGLEGVIQGDPTYRTESAGAVAGVRLGEGVELRLSAGASFQKDQDTEPYGSIGFSLLF